METLTITGETCVADLLEAYPQAMPLFIKHRMACVGCSMSSFETLADAARIYKVDFDEFMRELSQTIQNTPPAQSLRGPRERPFDGIPISGGDHLMPENYTVFPNLCQTIDAIPLESIVSRTIVRNDGLKAIMFAFAAGQELSRHTAAVPAVIQILEGDCEVILGEETFDAQPGFWAHMPANLPHSIYARTPTRMLLLMLSNAKPNKE